MVSPSHVASRHHFCTEGAVYVERAKWSALEPTILFKRQAQHNATHKIDSLSTANETISVPACRNLTRSRRLVITCRPIRCKRKTPLVTVPLMAGLVIFCNMRITKVAVRNASLLTSQSHL